MDENEEKEITEEPKEQPVTNEPPEETVGDLMKRANSDAIKTWVIIASVVVYLAGIVYAEVHGLTMLQKGVAEDLRFWATLGMIAAGITAVSLPVALKVWTIEATQRIAAYAFYALDFAFLVFNSFTDFNIQQIHTMAPWAQAYVTYVLPASPVVVAMGWALIWELDPGVREKITLLTLRAAMKKKMASKVADAARGAHVTEAVSRAASQEVDRALWELFGAKPADGYYVMGEPPKSGGLAASFFGWALRLVQSLASSGMASASSPSDSEEPENTPRA